MANCSPTGTGVLPPAKRRRASGGALPGDDSGGAGAGTGDTDEPNANKRALLLPLGVPEDLPSLALQREALRQRCLDTFATENAKFGSMRGTSKTAEACRRHGMRSGLQRLFARVLWTQKMREHLEPGAESEADPVFPAHSSVDAAVLRELVDGGRTAEDARHVLDTLLGALVDSARLMQSNRAERDRAEEAEEEEVVSIPTANIARGSETTNHADELCSLAFQGASYHIRFGHLLKLWRRYRSCTDAGAELDCKHFIRRVYCLLVRYETLSGHAVGYQMGLPAETFDLLSQAIYVDTECFASPVRELESRAHLIHLQLTQCFLSCTSS